MVIAKGKGGITAIVILADGEFLPQNLNNEKVLVFRQGDSTGRELKIVKPLGELAKEDLLRPPAEPICNYSGDGNPLHQHKDESWWYYDETWTLEAGPFDTYDLGYAALVSYCEALQTAKESLTNAEESDKVDE